MRHAMSNGNTPSMRHDLSRSARTLAMTTGLLAALPSFLLTGCNPPPSEEDLAGFAGSIEYWPPFPDTVAGLAALKKDFKLFALSNVDDELFAQSARVLGDPFDALISAEQIGAYKPDPRMFEALLDQAEGPVLHVAQSRYHDIVPATAAGLDTVWINRPSIGAARPVDATPTWTFDSLADFTAAWN